MFDKERDKRASFFFFFRKTNSHFYDGGEGWNCLWPIRRLDIVQLPTDICSMIFWRPLQWCCCLCCSPTFRTNRFQTPSSTTETLLQELTWHVNHSRYESAVPPAASTTEITEEIDAVQVSSAVLKSGARSSKRYSGAPL